jgi:hypothetical protein
MAARGLSESELTCATTTLDSLAVSALIADQAKVFTF